MPLGKDDMVRVPLALELETSELFVVDADKCKIKIIELATRPENGSSNHEAPVLERASNREEIETLLRVS